jgi:hypothetical protein
MIQAQLESNPGMVSLREPHKGVILQSQTQEELRPLFGRALLPSAEGATAGRGV